CSTPGPVPPPGSASASSCIPPPPTPIYTPSLHAALPISHRLLLLGHHVLRAGHSHRARTDDRALPRCWVSLRSGEEIPSTEEVRDRKSTRLNSSHVSISYAVFCSKKKEEH